MKPPHHGSMGAAVNQITKKHPRSGVEVALMLLTSRRCFASARPGTARHGTLGDGRSTGERPEAVCGGSVSGFLHGGRGRGWRCVPFVTLVGGGRGECGLVYPFSLFGQEGSCDVYVLGERESCALQQLAQARERCWGDAGRAGADTAASPGPTGDEVQQVLDGACVTAVTVLAGVPGLVFRARFAVGFPVLMMFLFSSLHPSLFLLFSPLPPPRCCLFLLYLCVS